MLLSRCYCILMNGKKQAIQDFVRENPHISYAEAGRQFGVSRQYVHKVVTRSSVARDVAKSTTLLHRIAKWLHV